MNTVQLITAPTTHIIVNVPCDTMLLLNWFSKHIVIVIEDEK